MSDTMDPEKPTPPPPQDTLWADQGVVRLLVRGFADIVSVLSSSTRRLEARLSAVEQVLAEIKGVVGPLARERVAEANAVLRLRQESVQASVAADEEVSQAHHRVQLARVEAEAEVVELKSAAVDTATALVRAGGDAARTQVARWIILAILAGACGLGAGQLDLLGQLARLAEPAAAVAPSPLPGGPDGPTPAPAGP